MNHIIKYLIICLCALSSAAMAPAQDSARITKSLNYKLPATPVVLDNYLFNTYIGAKNKAYNLKGFEMAKTSSPIVNIKVSPAGSSYMLLTSNGKKKRLSVYDAWKPGHKLHEFKKDIRPTAMAYSLDSRSIFVADDSGLMHQYEARKFKPIAQWEAPAGITDMELSSNGYFIAAIHGNEVAVINPETHALRTTLPCAAPVLDIEFSPDASLLAVLDQSGKISIYNTHDFTPVETSPIVRPGATAVSIHPENKYIAIARDGNNIELSCFVNDGPTLNISESSGKATYTHILQDGKKNVYVTYNAPNVVRYKQIVGLAPNRVKTMREEVIARMEEWAKMGMNETEEEYRARVNDETRLQQARLFEEEIATRMADDLVMRSEITLGGYDMGSNTLTIEFDNMPPVFINVPEGEVADFMDTGNIEFRNAKYGLTADDKFQLVYAEVYNSTTGKTYVFDNRDRRSLDFIYGSDDFVPIELVRQSGMEELKLADLRNAVVAQAKSEQLISDHTHIDVSTGIEQAYDADGKRINNYKVNFKYTVDDGFSSKEDFPAGKFDISTSHAAKSMLDIVTRAFANDFAQYLQPGKKAIIKVTGSADATPIARGLAYNGDFGDPIDEPCTVNGELSSIYIDSTSDIRKNEQLGFVRAYAVRDFIDKNVPQLKDMNVDYRYFVEVSEQKGSEFRRISVEFVFVDAF